MYVRVASGHQFRIQILVLLPCTWSPELSLHIRLWSSEDPCNLLYKQTIDSIIPVQNWRTQSPDSDNGFDSGKGTRYILVSLLTWSQRIRVRNQLWLRLPGNNTPNYVVFIFHPKLHGYSTSVVKYTNIINTIKYIILINYL